MSDGDRHLDPDALDSAALGQPTTAENAHHLAGCSLCRAEVDDLSAVVSLAREAEHDPPLTTPPDAVWGRIQAGLAGSPTIRQAPDDLPASPTGGSSASAGVTDLGQVRRKAESRLRFLPLLAAAVAGIVVGAGVVALVGDRQQSPEVLAAASLGPVAQGPADGQSGVAEIAVVDGVQMLSVTTANLADPDGFYEVWLLNLNTGGMIAMGTVPGGAHQTLLPVPPGVDLAEYRAVDISDEPFDGNPGHSSVSVLRGDLTT
ncbi:MAG: anti-sigma factor [Actinobacteria bacterium]|nr:anti-sigma factor [Actinomycetota bacterium]